MIGRRINHTNKGFNWKKLGYLTANLTISEFIIKRRTHYARLRPYLNLSIHYISVIYNVLTVAVFVIKSIINKKVCRY
jgi:hypothetical protein